MQYFSVYASPVGSLILESDGENLTGLHMNRVLPDRETALPVFDKARLWLDAYFQGRPRALDIPLRPAGTVFQQAVWELLLEIPYGETRSYGSIAREMAARLGKERMSAQAVGGAVGRNPIGILIPCHRVVGSRGQLTGYAGGLQNKQWLLHHEAVSRIGRF